MIFDYRIISIDTVDYNHYIDDDCIIHLMLKLIMKEINFEYTWCDYLTKCPYKSNIEVGSFDCHCCKYNEGLTFDKKEDEVKLMKISDEQYYKIRYGSLYTGICKCNH